ncbi:uncharacterized protein LOC144428358 [Styela clava]
MNDYIETKNLLPSEIRFVKSKVRSHFTTGKSANDIAETLMGKSWNKLEVKDLDVIRVFRREGRYYTLDDLLLYVFRVAQYNDAIRKIKVNVVSKRSLRSEKLSLAGGRNIILIGDETLPHCKPHWLKETGFTVFDETKVPTPITTVMDYSFLEGSTSSYGETNKLIDGEQVSVAEQSMLWKMFYEIWENVCRWIRQKVSNRRKQRNQII